MDDDEASWWQSILGFFFGGPTRFSWRGSSYNGATDRTFPWWGYLLAAALVGGVAWLGWISGK